MFQEMATVDEQFVDQTLIDIKVAEQQNFASRVPDILNQEEKESQVIGQLEARVRERRQRESREEGVVCRCSC